MPYEIMDWLSCDCKSKLVFLFFWRSAAFAYAITFFFDYDWLFVRLLVRLFKLFYDLLRSRDYLLFEADFLAGLL